MTTERVRDMHKRMWVMLVLALVLALVSAPLGGCTATSDGDEPTADAGDEPKEPYVVGAVLSLTGAQSGLGGPEKNAIDMEVARINEEGGINGHPLEVIIEDDASDVDQAIARTTKLIEQDGVVAIIGSTGTGQSMAMRDVIDAAGIPQVSLAGSLVITKDFDPLVFQTPWSNALVVDTTLEYLKAEGHTKIGLITEDTGFGKDGQALVNETAADYGLEVVSDQVFKPADTDMTGQLTVIKGAGADVVLMWSSVAASSIVPKNLEQLNLDIPLVCSHGIAKQEFIDGAGAAGEGVIAFAGKVLAPETYGVGSESYEAATGFVERYTAEYGVAPDHFAGHAYDGLYLVVEALKRLDEGFTSADLRDEIEKTSGFAGIGGVFTFSATDHNGMTADDIVMYRIEDGRWA
ncbi:MAG: ABC transporter substrate-binding protein, partial [Actinomycetota bacterium]|nr:ABC transporter substrate-binding protein [Actinomycetota bacterium]